MMSELLRISHFAFNPDRRGIVLDWWATWIWLNQNGQGNQKQLFFTVHQRQVFVDLVGFPRCLGSSRLIAKAVKEKPMSFGRLFEVIMGRTMDSCPRNLGDTPMNYGCIGTRTVIPKFFKWGKGASKGTPISSHCLTVGIHWGSSTCKCSIPESNQ